ncbi:MAG: hypothetical protein QNI90_05635 [Dinoroseobacter sp.]|nr:hypothetical protein [Dinoroseobacter sp.]MDJ0993034.1 hypothetical protein [Dinoroseobacter sp.]
MSTHLLTDDTFATSSVVGSEPREGLFKFVHPHRLRVRGMVLEGKVWLKARLHTDAPKPFLIYGRPRSGTTLLVDLLDQVNGVRCDGELLHSMVVRPVGFLRDLPKRAGPDVQAYGVKLLSYQLMEVQRVIRPLAFFEHLTSMNYSIIHLKRNTWDQTLSLAKAHHSGVYFTKDTDTTNLRLDPEKFVGLLRWNEAMLDYENAVMAQVPHIEINYETHLEDAHRHQSTVDELCRRLSISAQSKVEAPHTRTGGFRGSQKIENLDELVDAAVKAGFEHLRPRQAA